MKDRIFTCPLDCLAGVGEVLGGQYNVAIQVAGAPRVLDIGANVGAFSLYALGLWPQAQIIAYEPHPAIFRYLRQNTAQMAVTCVEAAVGDSSFARLRPGSDTRLCSSQYDLGRQGNASIDIKVIRPEDLPPADIIKIDTEGAEGYIVSHLQSHPRLLLVEYHTEVTRMQVECGLLSKMKLISSRVGRPGYGFLAFIAS
jgi:FkbM family methyltransferase